MISESDFATEQLDDIDHGGGKDLVDDSIHFRIVGFGRIGSSIAQACNTVFAMKVLAYNLLLTDEQKEKYQGWVTLTEECVTRMAVAGAQRVVDLFNGFVPENVANPEVLSLERGKYLRKK